MLQYLCTEHLQFICGYPQAQGRVLVDDKVVTWCACHGIFAVTLVRKQIQEMFWVKATIREAYLLSSI